jgi:hypothetical protein
VGHVINDHLKVTIAGFVPLFEIKILKGKSLANFAVLHIVARSCDIPKAARRLIVG